VIFSRFIGWLRSCALWPRHARYPCANAVKMVSFDGNVAAGHVGGVDVSMTNPSFESGKTVLAGERYPT
jgi:hypothetical protein